MNLPPVLVTDGTERAALAVVRSLGKAGYAVHVGSDRTRSLAGASRWARDERQLPSPLRDPEGFRSGIRAALEETGAGVLIPVSEASLLAILEHPEMLPEGVACPFPDLARFLRVTDKALVLDQAGRVGIAVPGQVRVDDVGATPPDPELPPYPLVIKPARSVAGSGGERGKFSVLHAADRAELDACLASLPPTAYPLLLQQTVKGEGIGVFLLLWKGEVLAVSGHRRLREKPPSGGVSVYRESVNPPAELVDRSVALLEAFSWEGVAMVEYKMDADGRTPYLMEINGRFWGSLQLAVDAGVDFPRMLVEAALGKAPGPPPAVVPGVRSRWWMGEVDHLIARLRRSARELHLPPGSPGRLAAVGSFLRHRPSVDRGEVFRLSDPGPGWRELADWVRGR